jgi:(E)-4-hydroxy-3-methylbut-2-enyl-diphosphate synthase
MGGVKIGGGAPVVVQSMTKTATQDVAATVNQIKDLGNAGCELVRLAVPDMEAASALREIRSQVSLPLVADIHFDYRLALAAIENGADGLRLNPGH